MTARIVKTWIFPLKGAGGIEKHSLDINPRVGVVGDRRFAVKRDPERQNIWAPKGAFYVSTNTPLMAAERPFFDAGRLDDMGLPQLDPDYLLTLADKLGLNHAPSLVRTNGQFSLTDSQTPYVSILNLETVRALSEFAGFDIDPRRFRMNVWIEGFPALRELRLVPDYPGRQFIGLGDKLLRVDNVCERCPAIEANPDTGTYDLELRKIIDAFMTSRKYAGSPGGQRMTVIGILATPCEKGTISVGDTVSA